MPLTRTRAQLRTDVRRKADVQGTSALVRFPDAELDDYIDEGYAAFYRKLVGASPESRLVTSATISTVNGTAVYALSGFTAAVTDLLMLSSVDIDLNGRKVWLTPYEPHERPELSDTNVTATGTPLHYRMRGENIEILPAPGGVYTLTIWYIPHQGSLASDATTVDTIQRLDGYIVYWAVREVALKDKHWDLHDRMGARLSEIEGDIEFLARSRDVNSPPRIVDVHRSATRMAHWRTGRR